MRYPAQTHAARALAELNRQAWLAARQREQRRRLALYGLALAAALAGLAFVLGWL